LHVAIDLNVKTRIPVAHHPVTLRRIRISLIGPLLCGVLVLITVLMNRGLQRDSVALLIVIIGVVQFVRGTMRGRITAGLRAAVISVALVLAILTPWMLTMAIVAGALLVALHLVDTRGIASYRRA
jgi:hypothetical protein